MPKFENLAYYTNVQSAIVPGSKSTGAVTAVAVDASGGFDRVQYCIHIGAVGVNAEFDCEITQASTAGATYTAITSSGMTAIHTAGANKVILIDVPVSGSKPYQKIRGTVGTAAVGICAVAYLYNGTRQLSTTMGDVAEQVFVA